MSKRLYCIAEFAPKAGKEQELFTVSSVRVFSDEI